MHHMRVPPTRRLLAIPLLSLAFGAVAAPASADLPACSEAPCAVDAGKQVVILDYYRDRVLPRLIRAAKLSGLPDDTPIYYGSYWGVGVNTRPPPTTPPPPPPPGPRPVMPGRRYSPIFSFARTNFWDARALTAEEQAAVAPGGITGKVPALTSLLRRSGQYRYDAGVEVGRRFRDIIRYKRAHHLRVVTWQFDEIPNEAVGPDGWKYRQLVRGNLRGMAYGRPELGDLKLPGIVFAPGKTILGIHDASFWNAVDDASLYFVGEEYPDFVGAPGAAARQIATWPNRLPPSLALKYVAGLTPGYRLGAGLGGNVQHRSASFVSRWQLSYVRARAQQRLAGFAQYNFNYHNASAAVMNDVLHTLGRGVRLLRGQT
jgi:hypothetical protein